MPRTYRLEQAQVIERPLDEVFAFFSDADNLEAITPEFLRFRILSSRPIVMQAGARIDYRLQLHGVPFHWQTRIDEFRPPRYFVDSQVTGPYRQWIHRHEFHSFPGGTLVLDLVDYQIPLGPLGRLARRWFVRRALAEIFAHRRRRIAELLPPWR